MIESGEGRERGDRRRRSRRKEREGWREKNVKNQFTNEINYSIQQLDC